MLYLSNIVEVWGKLGWLLKYDKDGVFLEDRKISISSQNTRGINCNQKCRDLFQHLSQKSIILFVCKMFI